MARGRTTHNGQSIAIWPVAPPIAPTPAAPAAGGLPFRQPPTSWPGVPVVGPSSAPPLPVPAKVGPAKLGDESVWASGGNRNDAPTGQSIGQMAAAAASTAAHAAPIDAAAGVLAASTAAAGTTAGTMPSPALLRERGDLHSVRSSNFPCVAVSAHSYVDRTLVEPHHRVSFYK